MGVTTNLINKPFNPRAQDQSPKGYNRAKLYSGKALDFDGVNDYVDVPYLDSLANTGVSSTLSFYFNTDTLSSTDVLFEQRGVDSGKRYVVWISPADNSFNLYLNSGSDSISTKIVETNKWYHFASVVDGSEGKMYINGQLIGSTSYTPFLTETYCYFGNQPTSSNYYGGSLTNAKIFNTALTAAQVADLYNNPEKVVPTGLESNLKLWLPMMEGAGTYCINGVADELVENGDFNNVTGGKPDDFVVVGTETGTNYISASSGQLSIVSDGNYIGVEQYPLTIGKTYNIRVDVDSITGPGELSVYLGSGTDYHISAAGIYTIQITATATDFELKRRAGLGAVTAIINSFSIKEVGGEINGATWTHGIGAPVAQTAVIDWNHQSLGGVSNILIPQGLTSGRDLLGNLFENVRKQGALNLDGNSWAEVHDNESLDFGTGSFSLEAWARAKYVNTGSSYNVLLTIGGNVSTHNTGSLYIDSSLNYTFRYDSNLIVAGGSSEGDWSHVVGVYDGTNINIYLNGSFVTQAAASATSKTNTFVKVIGSDDTAASRTYKDQIAQPRIYNRALTAEEVLKNYNAGKNTYTN